MRNVKCLKELLKGESSGKDTISETPIMVAIKNNQPEAVHLLIDAGEDPDIKIKDLYIFFKWKCALSTACFNHVDGKVEFVRYLLSKISEIDIPSLEQKEAAVHWICRSKSPEIVKMVLERGIDVNRFDEKGRPGPYHLVDSSKVPYQSIIEILDLLHQYGYDLNKFSRNPPGETILAHFLRSIEINDGVMSIIEWLLEHGASPTIKFQDGKRPIDIVKRPKLKSLLEKYISKPES